jgi:hypothetical protein
MSAQNENIIIAVEIIEEDVADIPVITQAELLETDYTGDEGAEFLCELFNTINYLESYLENPEDLCLPDEKQDGELPYIIFIEKLNELRNYTWAKRTLTRMTRLAEGIQATQRLTQLQKSEHPDYVQCPNCLDYFLNKRNGLEKHMANPICAERNARMFVKGNDKKLPSGKYLHTVMVMNDLIGRSIAYKKNIEPELKEEKINDYVYELKTYQLDGEYGGLFELDGKKEWENIDEAQEAFDVAISTEEFSMVEFIRIDPNSNEHRETIIDIWEKDYKSEYTYVVKVYLGDDYQHNYIYNEKGSWSDQEEAKEAFRKAIECQEYSFIELVCKTGDDDYDEQQIDEWETDDTCYECGRPLPDGEYQNGEELVCYHCWGGETTKTDSEDEDEEDECVYVIKTWDYNREKKVIEYQGLWKKYEGDEKFKTEKEAREEFEDITENGLGIAFANITKIDPNSEDRETIIEEYDWGGGGVILDTKDKYDEDDECEFCGWRSEYPESHIQYGNVKCEYITDKYNIVFNEDGEIHSVLRNPV